ncbi:putative beta-lysine N-acetyltransferase [Desulfurivibrio sp. D14AmB]|uniref:putative beta-lysine N-acetyltransferase n=1 Tax=Desulfurivibrio sp. D14AmB TaxID=3374370 RepID=UPI00376EB18F
MNSDRTITIGRSLIQHGKSSDRVYLMKAADEDMPGLLNELERLAGQEDYGKIFAKAPARWGREFAAAGYRVEAEVPGFYQGRESGLFLGKYFKEERAEMAAGEEIAAVLNLCAQKETATPAPAQSPGEDYLVRLCTPADCEAMAELYRRVFPSYPFPIHDPEFLGRTMAEQVCYVGAWRQGRPAALASAEFSATASHAEMTDFATAPEDRGRRLAARLLTGLEEEMAAREIKLAYTIARALSPGMNLAFARAGYRHAGTLVNNTQICGRIESMNVWHKPLASQG